MDHAVMMQVLDASESLIDYHLDHVLSESIWILVAAHMAHVLC